MPAIKTENAVSHSITQNSYNKTGNASVGGGGSNSLPNKICRLQVIQLHKLKYLYTIYENDITITQHQKASKIALET